MYELFAPVAPTYRFATAVMLFGFKNAKFLAESIKVSKVNEVDSFMSKQSVEKSSARRAASICTGSYIVVATA